MDQNGSKETPINITPETSIKIYMITSMQQKYPKIGTEDIPPTAQTPALPALDSQANLITSTLEEVIDRCKCPLAEPAVKRWRRN